MSHSEEGHDVIVIGGGPAGSTVASLLAMKGHRVALFEKATFPREHVGESLLPFCYSVFDELGVLDQIADRYVRKPGVRFVDADGNATTTWCFGHVIKDESYLSFHVRRETFDAILLDNSRDKGVAVHEGARVREVELEAEGGVEVVVERDGSRSTHRARFLVDASGRDTFLATKNRWKRPHPTLDRTAISTHWGGGRYVEGIEQGLLQIVYLGGEKKGWIWVIPVGADRLSVGVVMDHAHIKKRKAALGDDWQEALYREELDAAPFVRDILADAEILQPLMLNGNYSYQVEHKFGPTYCMVGDSGAFIDPIFASGVYLALQSSRLVAGALDALLNGGDRDALLEEAYGQIGGAYALVDRAIALFYNPTALNFAQLGSASAMLHKQHETALAVGHYLLAGDFFANHAEYYSFLDLLEDPRTLEKYKALVIDRSEFQSSSCGLSRVQIFHRLLQESAG